GFTSGGLLGQYFNNTTLSGSPSFTRQDDRIDFTPTIQAPGGSTSTAFSAVNATNWSARWTGQLIPAFSETYTFSAFAQDTFNRQLKQATDTSWTTVIDQTAFSGTGSSGSFALSAGVAYDVQVTFAHGAGASWAAQLHWSSPSTPDEAIEPFSVSAI